MKFSVLSSAILLVTIPTTVTFASGLDRSGQSMTAFLQPGNYAEAGMSFLSPSVQGHSTVSGHEGEKIGNMADNYYFPSAAIKVQATDHISLGLLYDQPFGANATYALEDGTFDNAKESTEVEVRTHNLTGLIGYQPTENWNIYGGAVWQTVEADIHLRGDAYSRLSGYDISVDQKEAWGWIAGLAYQIPEIALKASVTYRSEIEHNAKTTEKTTLAELNPAYAVFSNRVSQVNATTPQSVNLDFQTGITQKTLAFANVRWVHWDQFTVTPSLLAQVSAAVSPTHKSQNLIDYTDDQWSANIGLGHKFNDKWSASATAGWDSGAGNPVTTLGPTNGYWSVGLGGQYSPTANTFLQTGIKYYGLGDAKAKTAGAIVGEFQDNYALGYGFKIGYKF